MLRRWLSPSVFTLVALCFLLPFATVSYVGGCENSGEPGEASFTGIQLVTRTVPTATGADNRHWAHELSNYVEHTSATAAEIAFAAAIVGLVLGLLGLAGGPGLCAAVGLGAVLQLPFTIGDGYEWDAHAGHWLTLAGFAGAGALHFLRWAERRRIAGGRSRAEWFGIGAGVLALTVALPVSAFALRPIGFVIWLVAVASAGYLYVRRWRARKRTGVASSATYWELVVVGTVAIYISLIVGGLLHALWVVPLLWAVGLQITRRVKEAKAIPQSGALP